MQILIVDDSGIIRDRLMSLLSDIPGVAVVGTAGSGIDALSELKHRDPSTAVVILTNYLDDQYRRLCEAAGRTSSWMNRRSSSACPR